METKSGIEELSSSINSCPRDLLRRFAGDVGGDERSGIAGGDMGEIELSLGLSLGGCFGMEPRDNSRLVRSSSLAAVSVFPVDQADFPAVTVPLTRTWSLPAETNEERRKRKEMQSLKRMEAKRKRSEKRAAAKDRKEENLDEAENSGQFIGKVNGVVLPSELPIWAVGAGRGAAGVGGARPASQGSIGSQGSSSSAVSDFESTPMQGLDVSGLGNCAEVRSPSTMPPASDNNNHKASTTPPKQVVGKLANVNLSREGDEPSRKKSCMTGRAKEMEVNMMEEMPYVSTRGDGPNGRRIEGFLYKYRKGEDVRIVCVCHGSFLTPAEFVKHAGGGDVAHPLRHIVVNPTPSAFF